MFGNSPSEAQDTYVRALQKRLHLPNALLDNHCIQRFGAAYAALNRGDVSLLLDEMIGWEQMPADLQRAQGQQDLFTL